jgi:hypothetical protein
MKKQTVLAVIYAVIFLFFLMMLSGCKQRVILEDNVKRITHLECFDLLGILINHKEIIYDTGSRIISTSNYFPAPGLPSYSTYEYDETGTLLKVSGYDFQDTLTSYTVFAHDSGVKIIQKNFFSPADVPQGYSTLSYDSAGRLTRTTEFSASNDITCYTLI